MFMQFILKIFSLDKSIENEVFALRITEDRKKILEQNNIMVYSPPNNNYNLNFRLNIINIILKGNFDIIHGQNFSGNLWASIGSLFQSKKIKLISHEHGGSWGAEGIHRFLSYFWAKKSDLIICNSKAAKEIIRQKIFKRANLKLIYNGVQSSKPKIKKDLNDDSFNILFVGRLEEVKGIKELFKALKILNNQEFNFSCNILGSGKLKNWLNNFVKKNELDSKIFLHGVVGNVDDFMSKSDLMVLPSIREPLGNVIIEAANQSLPTIATRVDGIQEIIIHNKTGVLINPRHESSLKDLPRHVIGNSSNLVHPKSIDPEELANEILKLGKNKSLLKNYGLEAKELLKGFTIENYTNEIYEVYKTL